jgi:molybdenum cofactor biosynthesis protein A
MENQPKLYDRFGRIHDYLRISLTEKCNLRCFYCMPEEGIPLRNRAHFMNKEEVLEIAKAFTGMGIRKIRLTGGEPLVCKDVDEIILGLAKQNVELAITTNGVLVDQHIETFKKAGLSNINISLDSLQKEKLVKITRRDYSDKIFNNIDLLIHKGFNVKVNAVLIKGVNDDEILDFIEWTKETPVSVRFIEYMPFTGNKWDWDKGIGLDKISACAKEKYGNGLLKMPGAKHDTAKHFKIEGHIGSFAVISSVTNPFCDTCNRIRLTADGKIKNCLFSGGETDLLSAFRNGQDILPLINESILNKKAYRGGMDSFEKFSDPLLNQNNRSMVAIGG